MMATKETMQATDLCTCGDSWGRHRSTGECTNCECGCFLVASPPRPGSRGGPKGYRKWPTPDGLCRAGCGRKYRPGRGSKGRCPACSRKAQRAAKPRIAAALEERS